MTRLVLQGFFISCDKYNRIKIMFLDDYECNEDNTSLITNSTGKKISFTKSYMIKKSNPKNGKNPITDGNKCFNAKCGKIAVGFINNQPVALVDLKQHKVELDVEIKKYYFAKMGNVINGWNILCVF